MGDEKNIEIKFDVKLSKSEQKTILQNLNLDSDSSSILDEVLGKMAEASFNEYRRMLTGVSVPNTAVEFRLERMYNLLMYYFNTAVPDEEIISTIFHIPNNTSRQLIKNTLSRHRFDLKNKVNQTIKAILDQKKVYGKNSPKIYYLEISDSGIAGFLNQIIAKEKPGLKKLYLGKDNQAGIYFCTEDTFSFLSGRFK